MASKTANCISQQMLAFTNFQSDLAFSGDGKLSGLCKCLRRSLKVTQFPQAISLLSKDVTLQL